MCIDHGLYCLRICAQTVESDQMRVVRVGVYVNTLILVTVFRWL